MSSSSAMKPSSDEATRYCVSGRPEPMSSSCDTRSAAAARGKNTVRVGLTGGVASGKSTVSAILRELGAVVIDADQLAREVVAKGTPRARRGRRGVRPEQVLTDGRRARPPRGGPDRVRRRGRPPPSRGRRPPAGARGGRPPGGRGAGGAGRGPRHPAAGRVRAGRLLRRRARRRRRPRGAQVDRMVRGPRLDRGGGRVADRSPGVSREDRRPSRRTSSRTPARSTSCGSASRSLRSELVAHSCR